MSARADSVRSILYALGANLAIAAAKTAAAIATGSSAMLAEACRVSRDSMALLRARRRGLILDLEEHLVLPDHSQLRARALLDRLGALLEVADLGGERRVAALQLEIPRPFDLQLALQAPRRQPAALAQPERVLDEHDQRTEDAGEDSHLRWANASRPG